MSQPWDIAGSFNEGAKGGLQVDQGLIDKAGQVAAGKALMQMFNPPVPGAQPMPGQQPMAPQMAQRPPMQAPVPGAQPMQPQMGGPPQQPQMPQMPQQAPQQQPQQIGQAPTGMLDWKSVVQQVKAANPGADPRVIMTAVNQFLPLMTQQAQMEWKQVMLQQRQQGLGIQQQRADQQEQLGQERVGVAQQQADTSARRADTSADQGQQRIDLGKQREQRLTGSTQVRQDQGWQRLELQKNALQQRIQESGDRRLLNQWRATLDAQHKRAMEIIQANALGSGLGDKDKKKLLDEEDKAYTDAIKQMRSTGGDTSPASAGGAPNAKQGGDQPVKVQTPADAAKLPPGTRYITPEGTEHVRGSGKQSSADEGRVVSDASPQPVKAGQKYAANDVPDSVLSILGGYARGSASAADVRKHLNGIGWKMGKRINAEKYNIEVISPDGSVHLIDNGDL